MAITLHPKRQHYHKKARGDHHKRNKHYLKAYHPYLPLLLLVVVGLAVNNIWADRTAVLGASTNLSASSLLLSTNRERLTNNQDPLKIDDKLSSAAQAKANDMASKNYWSHVTPDGDEPWTFIQKSGYAYYAAGENLAYGFGNAEQTVAGWMNSREHRTNMLSTDYTEVGFGIAAARNYQTRGNTSIIVAMYAEPSILDDGDPSSLATTASSDLPIRTVSRVQLLTGGQAPWSLFVVTVMSFSALLWFATRHYRAWRIAISESESFIWKHPLLDIMIITIAVAGFVLTRTTGIIQ